MHKLSLVAEGGGYSLDEAHSLLIEVAGLVVLQHMNSSLVLPDQGSNRCPLHWQENSQPLDHQRSPGSVIYTEGNAQILICHHCVDKYIDTCVNSHCIKTQKISITPEPFFFPYFSYSTQVVNTALIYFIRNTLYLF